MSAVDKQLAPNCRLAVERPEYADEHERCRGTTTVHVPGGSFTGQHCDCACHQLDAER